MFSLLTKVLGYKGDVESHLWPSVVSAWHELDEAVQRMGGEQSPAFQHFTIGKAGLKATKQKFAEVVLNIYEEKFGPRWVDKTPGAEMIYAVEAIAETLPNAKFIQVDPLNRAAMNGPIRWGLGGKFGIRLGGENSR